LLDKYLETLAERLREKRQEKGYTQEQAAELVGSTLRTIQNHESGRCKPPRLRLKRYASIYGCSWEWLLTGESPYHQPEEHMLPRKEHELPDSGPGQMRLPDFGSYSITRVFGPEEGRRKHLHLMLDAILTSDNVPLKNALINALEQIVLLLKQTKKIEEISQKPPPVPEQPSPSSKNR
jgi:transcriptional regulator with XRE-family HTH domain